MVHDTELGHSFTIFLRVRIINQVEPAWTRAGTATAPYRIEAALYDFWAVVRVTYPLSVGNAKGLKQYDGR